MRYCEECLDKLIKSMKKNAEPPIYENFNPKSYYYLDKTICDKCGAKLSRKMQKQWILGEKMYENN